MPMRGPTLIGFGHLSGTGKDEAAKVLVERHGFTRLAFADRVRAITYDTDPVVRRWVDIHGWDAAKRAHAHVRMALENVGNALRTHLYPKILSDLVMADADTHHRVVVTDVRHLDEVQAIEACGGMVVRIDRPGVVIRHAMDRELERFTGWAAVIANSGTLEDLAEKVESLL